MVMTVDYTPVYQRYIGTKTETERKKEREEERQTERQKEREIERDKLMKVFFFKCIWEIRADNPSLAVKVMNETNQFFQVKRLGWK